jgi:thioredoxin 1
MKKTIAIFTLLLVVVAAFNLSAETAKEIKTTDKNLPEIIDFGAKQCKACKAMEPVLHTLAQKYAESFKTTFVDVWQPENEAKARQFNIRSIPTQVFISAEGKELWRHTGFISEKDILAKWNEFGVKAETPKPAEPRKTSENTCSSCSQCSN